MQVNISNRNKLAATLLQLFATICLTANSSPYFKLSPERKSFALSLNRQQNRFVASSNLFANERQVESNKQDQISRQTSTIRPMSSRRLKQEPILKDSVDRDSINDFEETANEPKLESK